MGRCKRSNFTKDTNCVSHHQHEVNKIATFVVIYQRSWLHLLPPRCSTSNKARLHFVFCEHGLCTSVIGCSSNSSFMPGPMLLILFHQPLSVVCLTVDIKHSYYIFNWIGVVPLRDAGKYFSRKMKHSLNLCCVLSASPTLISWSVVCPHKFPGPKSFLFFLFLSF